MSTTILWTWLQLSCQHACLQYSAILAGMTLSDAPHTHDQCDHEAPRQVPKNTCDAQLMALIRRIRSLRSTCILRGQVSI